MDQSVAQFVSSYFADAPQEALNSQMGWLLEQYFSLKCHVEINYFNYSYMLLYVEAKWHSFCHGCQFPDFSAFILRKRSRYELKIPIFGGHPRMLGELEVCVTHKQKF